MEKLDVTQMMVIILTLTMVITMTYLFIFRFRQTKEPEKGKEKFFQYLDSQFGLDLIKDRSDFEIVRNKIERDFGETYSLSPLLEDYLMHLIKSNSEIEDKEKVKETYDFVKDVINKENEEKPFTGVPEEERRLLISIKNAIEHKDDHAAKLNINELGSVTAVRNRTYLKTLKVNRWALPLAIVGVVISIIFGIMNLASRISYNKIENMLRNSFQTQMTEAPKK